MANNLTTQSTTLATVPASSIIETEDQGAGVQRQIVKVGNTVTVTGTVADSNFPTTVDVNSGAKSNSTLRVVLATDQPALTNKLLVTPDSVALPANQSVNVAQINGVTTTMGNGVSGTGVQRVTLASDSTGQVATVARDLLYDTGTNGYIASLTLTAGADLASLASGGAVTLTGGGSSGVSSQSNTGSGLLAEVVFKTVTAGFTPTAGGVIAGWWLKSDDGGSNYETTPATPSTTVPALPRPPDFIIPLDAAALGTSAIKFSNVCVPPAGTFKCLVQNMSGAAFGAGNYTLTLRVFARKN